MDSQLDRKKLEELSFDIEELELMLAELLESTFEFKAQDFENPVRLSFILSFDKEGMPKIESFAKSTFVPQKFARSFEPISRIDEDTENYVITMDLLGHEKDDIEAVLGTNFLVVMSRKNKPFYKKFFLKNMIDQTIIRKTLKNNVLEVILKKQLQQLP